MRNAASSRSTLICTYAHGPADNWKSVVLAVKSAEWVGRKHASISSAMAHQIPADQQRSRRNALFAFYAILLGIVPTGLVLATFVLIIQGALSGGH